MVELWRDFIDNDDTDEDLEEVELNEYQFVWEHMCDAAGGESSGCGSTCEGGSCSSTGPSEHPGLARDGRQFHTPPCLKCSAARAQFVARQREPLCRVCMEASVLNKVKTALVGSGKKTKALLGQDDVLTAACSGGFNSMAMIHIVTELANLEAQRARVGPRFRRGMKVIHVVTSQGSNSSETDRIRETVLGIDPAIEFHAVPLSFVLEKDEDLAAFLHGAPAQSVPGSDPCLDSLVDKCTHSKSSSRSDVHKLLVKLLLLRSAKILGCTKVAMGCNATYFAMHTLSSILKGSGFALPADIQYLDARFASLGLPDVIHPVRDIVAKELLLTCYLRGIDFVSRPEKDLFGDKTSVKSLCKDFVFQAQDRLPSTVMTVMKTASKLDYNGIREEENRVLDDQGRIKEEKMCSLCSSPMCTSSKDFALSQQHQLDHRSAWNSSMMGSYCYSCFSMFGNINENLKLWSPNINQAFLKSYFTKGVPSNDIREIDFVQIEEEAAAVQRVRSARGGRRHHVTCAYCKEKRAMLKRPKTKENVCKECFYQAFEEEIHETIVHEKIFTRGDRVAIGASGGKDSTVLIHVLKTLNERHDYGLELFLLSVDEGIKGYRDDSLETVARNEVQYELPLKVVSYKDLYGYTMDDIVARIGLKNNCTFCGVFRRQALDRGANLLGATKIVTGHNADDIAETVFLNVLRGDFARLTRCTNSITGEDSALPRCKPFKYAYEKEIVMYAHHKRLDYFATECTYSPQANRGYAREFIKEVERIEPVCLLNSIISCDEMAVGSGGESSTGQVKKCCEKCGYITSQRICKACVLLEGLDSGNHRSAIYGSQMR